MQNELIQDMALSVLRSYIHEIKEATYAIMLDESTDSSIKNKSVYVLDTCLMTSL
jgi:hypothetical protein